MEFKNSGTEIFRIDLDEIRKLREEVEALRRDVARLHGRLDVVQHFFWEIEERKIEQEEQLEWKKDS